MKNLTLFLALSAIFLPACQNPQMKEKLENADRQIESYQNQNNQLRGENDMHQAELASMEEQLAFEQDRAAKITDRLQAMEASAREADAEVVKLRSQLAGTGVGVERRGDVLVLSLPSGLTFSSGSATLNTKGRSSLKSVAGALKASYSEKTFWVEGHTDNEQLKKSKEKWKTNLRLSIERAMAVSDYLIAEMGVEGSQIRIAGHGEFDPAVANDNQKNRAKNRRVEILILD
jgi:flagellar motor protein MotB